MPILNTTERWGFVSIGLHWLTLLLILGLVWFGRSTGVLRTTLGDANVLESAPSMPAEDFSLFLNRVPGLFFFLGVTPKGKDPLSMPANHSPMYDVDEASFPTGVKALSALALDALLRGVPVLGPAK